jgi:hypothetical protein
VSQSGAETSVAPRVRPLVGSVVFAIVATAVQVLRQPGTKMWRTVWAEDGLVFFSDALHHSMVDNIFRPYAGYGLALTRILAQFGAHLPADRYALWITFSATGIVSLLALFVYWASAPMLQAPFRRAILAGAMVVLPVLPFEVLGTISNLQWFLPLACLFAVLLPVDRPGAIAVRLPIVVFGPLSSPFCLAFGPIVVAQLVVLALDRRKGRAVGRSRLVVPIAYLVACVGQLAIYSFAEREERITVPLSDTVRSVIHLYPTRVATDLVFGVHYTTKLWRSFGYGLAAMAMLILAALLVSKLAKANTITRLWVVALVGGGAGLFVLSVVVRSEYLSAIVSTGDRDYSFGATRYEVFPAFLLILALLLPLHLPSGLLLGQRHNESSMGDDDVGRSGVDRLSGDLPWKGAIVLTVAWFAIAIVPSWRFDNARSPGPSWPAGIHAAQEACKLDAQLAAKIVAISPAPQWTVPMTCAELGVTGD